MNKPIAVITGASSGIGESLALKLSDKYFVYLIARNMDKLQKVADKILEKKNDCQIIQADISKKESFDLISSKIDNKDNIEILINNAGLAVFDDISSLSIEDWDNQININLTGSFLMTKMVIDDLKFRKKGAIVFINSVAGLHPYKNSTAYVASKYGLRGFSSSLREELREYGIKVISVYPGAIDTSLWDGMNMDSLRPDMMKVDDVADIIIDAVHVSNNCVVEEIKIRRIAGDF